MTIVIIKSCRIGQGKYQRGRVTTQPEPIARALIRLGVARPADA